MFKLNSPVLSGFLKGLIFLTLMGIVYGLLMFFTEIPETASPYLTLAILALSVFGGGFGAARQAGAKGLIIGLEVALLFVILILGITLVFRPGYFDWGAALLKLGLVLLAGMLGGMTGVAFCQK